jgi:Zn-dependent M28 family amino/carboxypeptidase
VHLAIGQLDGAQLTEWLSDGFEVEVELSADSSSSGSATSENLAVTIDGSDGAVGSNEVVVCAHYDTFWNTPGAYDNGSGTVALLQLAAEWSRHPPHRATRIVFFTAEEWHLAGSRSFVSSASQSALDSVDFVLNIDGLGRGDTLEVFAGPERFEQELTEEIRTFAARSRGNLRVVSRFPPTMGTDHASFYAAGVPSAHVTFNDLHRLHQPDDLPNAGIAANIAWTVALVQRLVDVVPRPHRGPIGGHI